MRNIDLKVTYRIQFLMLFENLFPTSTFPDKEF